jgi:thiosulfate dehydrogenase
MIRQILLFLSACCLGTTLAAAQTRDYQVELPASPDSAPGFAPPPESEIPDDRFGEMVRYGRDLFVNTQQLRGKYVGNDMNCVNCHLDAGRRADSAPLWAAYTMYPAYRKKNDRVNTLEERIQGCFRYSMNGSPPPSGSPELTALITYHYWLAKGAPTGVALEGRGYPELDAPKKQPDIRRGREVFQAQCAICHGDDGMGRKAEGDVVFPPLWGEGAYNWGAGMHRINTAAAFIHANMPLGKPYSLSEQQSWDVAAYINSHERLQDPRYEGDLEATDQTFHSHQCFYGDKVDGHVLGTRSYPNPLE